MPPRKTIKTTKTAEIKAAPKVAPAAPVVIEKSEVKGSGTTAKPVAAPRALTHDMIARRAFEIYASRGYAPGDQKADWLEAERQLRAGL